MVKAEGLLGSQFWKGVGAGSAPVRVGGRPGRGPVAGGERGGVSALAVPLPWSVERGTGPGGVRGGDRQGPPPLSAAGRGCGPAGCAAMCALGPGVQGTPAVARVPAGVRCPRVRHRPARPRPSPSHGTGVTPGVIRPPRGGRCDGRCHYEAGLGPRKGPGSGDPGSGSQPGSGSACGTAGGPRRHEARTVAAVRRRRASSGCALSVSAAQ